MIAKASAIQHGQAMTNYATKNNRADIVKTNHLSEGLPPMGMWDEMVLHQSMFKQRYAKKPIELTSIRFELSPSEEEARNWTMEDWRRFLDEFIREMDGISKVNHIGKKKGKAATSVKPTNIANSQYFAALHRDSKSGIPHLHLVVNRIDMDGNLNDVKFIGERAVMAAKAINQRHGWKDAMDIRQERIAEVTKACMDVLRSMPFFDWDEYADRLRAKGYDIELIRDKNGQGRVHGYRFKFGKTTIKASELGVGRNLTASKIGNTFRKLHPQPTLWEYLLILLMVCERYIDHGCYAKDFAKESSCVEFKQRAYEIAKQYAHHSSAIVRQMSGSIIGYMGDNDVWDIFCNVMLKKRDLLTISHITLGIRRHCTGVANGDNHFFGGTMTNNQRIDILNSLRLVYQKSSNKSIKGMCLRTIEELENTKEVANKA